MREFLNGKAEQYRCNCAEGTHRKRLVVKHRRYERVYKLIADSNVTFYEKGGTVKRVTDFFVQKNRNKRNLFRRSCGRRT